MTSVSISRQQQAYRAASTEPMSSKEIKAPVIATALATALLGTALLVSTTGFNPLTVSFSSAAVAVLGVAGCFYGSEFYTDWMPRLAGILKGKIERLRAKAPNADTVSKLSYFDRNLATALVGLAEEKKVKKKDFYYGEFNYSGNGEYSVFMKSSGIDSVGYNFNPRSAFVNQHVWPASLRTATPSATHDLVTLLSDYMSKIEPVFRSALCLKLIRTTEEKGMIVVNCVDSALQQLVVSIFEANGCEQDPETTHKLRRLTHPLYLQLRQHLIVFQKKEER